MFGRADDGWAVDRSLEAALDPRLLTQLHHDKARERGDSFSSHRSAVLLPIPRFYLRPYSWVALGGLPWCKPAQHHPRRCASTRPADNRRRHSKLQPLLEAEDAEYYLLKAFRREANFTATSTPLIPFCSAQVASDLGICAKLTCSDARNRGP